MPAELRLIYLCHSLRSDWNNGNAHFLRGLLREMSALGHDVTVLEPESEWSIDNLLLEANGGRSLSDFKAIYPELNVETYTTEEGSERWRERLRRADLVILHEWNPPALAQKLLQLRGQLGFKLLFHDTHHRASSSPGQIQQFGLSRFDGILAFGESLRIIYQQQFGISHVWTLHEAADSAVFRPQLEFSRRKEVVWVGNWGEGERAGEIEEFFLKPAAVLSPATRFKIYGVRYPEEGLRALQKSGVDYGGYLPNLDAPAVYAQAALTVHIPRQQYLSAMKGIPTIRVFEALACGIPLLSAPWMDTEDLFRPGDYCVVRNTSEMISAMQTLLDNPRFASHQAERGRETVLARHTCAHRAEELTQICKELLS